MDHGTLILVALVPVVGVLAQWLARRLHVPAIVFLLGAGLLVGPVLGLLDPGRVFGDLLEPIVRLGVALILFEGGLSLRWWELKSAGSGIRRLVFPGVPVAWLGGSLAARLVGGLSWPVSIVFGAIVVVTGPTVIIPLLRHARLRRRTPRSNPRPGTRSSITRHLRRRRREANERWCGELRTGVRPCRGTLARTVWTSSTSAVTLSRAVRSPASGILPRRGARRRTPASSESTFGINLSITGGSGRMGERREGGQMFGKKRRHRHRRRIRARPGAAPGTIHVDPEAPKPVIRLMAYGEGRLDEATIEDPADLRSHLGGEGVAWVNVDGLGDEAVLRELGEIFGIHKLALEDVVNVHQRDKVESYPEHAFIVARMVRIEDGLQTEQVSLFVGEGYVLTFQERAGDCFDAVRDRIRKGKGRIRKAGPDYLAYALLDAIVDHLFPVLEHYGERLDALEDEILATPDQESLMRVHFVKRELLALRRAVWPKREALSSLVREPGDQFAEETRIYLRDCYDHAIQILDITETYRELASGLVDAYLSNVSNRMNEVMKVLTIIATIFIPLTFLAGIYGMNFDLMPELKWSWSYPALLVLMLIVAVGLLIFFRRKGWLGAPKATRTEPPDPTNPHP